MTAADRPEVDDPRVLALAKARQQMAHDNPFNAGFCPPWEALSEQEQRLGLLDARNYLRAALKAGLFASSAVSVVPPATNQTALSDAERQFLTFALDLAFDRMVSDDGFTDEDEAALAKLRRLAAEAPHAETRDAVVARVLYVAEVIEANGIGWAADSVRRACRGDAEQPRTCAHCGQVHDSSSLTHFGAPGGPWYCVDRDDCRGAGGLPPRTPATPPAVVAQPGKETAVEDPPVVAYRSSDGRSLYCTAHAGELFGLGYEPVTAEDLPDGGICTYPNCGVDVLIPQAPQAPQ